MSATDKTLGAFQDYLNAEAENRYYFTLTVTKRTNGTAKFIEVEVYDPDNSDPVALPIATATAPAYGQDGLERAVQRAFSELQLPESELCECEGDGCTLCTQFCGDCLTPLENCGCKP